MRKKVYAIAAILMLTIAALTVSNTNANADEAVVMDAPSRFNYNNCITVTQNPGGRTYKHCLDVGWKPQDDGAGVSFEDTTITTPSGCGWIQDSIYRNVEPRMYRHPEHTLFLTGNWGNDSCTTHHDYAWRGEQTGCTDLRVTMDVYTEGSNYDDYEIMWRQYFCANGAVGVETERISII